jgi:hypothetical protein
MSISITLAIQMAITITLANVLIMKIMPITAAY